MKSKHNPPMDKIRRRFFWPFLLGSAVGLLSGCGEKTAVQSIPTASAREVSTSAAEKVVTIYTWDEYLNPALLTEFEERTGIRVERLNYESSDEMVEGLKSEPGRYDLFVTEDGYIPILAGKRLIKPLEHERLSNWKNLDAGHTDPPFDPKNEFTVPYLWGTTLLAYRKDLLPNPKHSWSLIFDPALKDKISFLDDRMECYAGVLRTMQINLPDADAGAIGKAADALVNLVNEGGLKLGGDNEMKSHLLDGLSSVAMIYSGDAARIANENKGVPIGYFIPEEGATVWTDSFCISRDTTRLENAYKFLDFMLEAKSAAASTNFLHYASPNRAAVEYIDPGVLADQTIYPRPEVLDKCRYFKLKSVDSQREVNKGWRRVQEAWLSRSGQVSGETEAPEEAGAPPALIQ